MQASSPVEDASLAEPWLGKTPQATLTEHKLRELGLHYWLPDHNADVVTQTHLCVLLV